MRLPIKLRPDPSKSSQPCVPDRAYWAKKRVAGFLIMFHCLKVSCAVLGNFEPFADPGSLSFTFSFAVFFKSLPSSYLRCLSCGVEVYLVWLIEKRRDVDGIEYMDLHELRTDIMIRSRKQNPEWRMALEQ
jgi:hypothetical protein